MPLGPLTRRAKSLLLAAALLAPTAALAQAPAPQAGKITSLIPVDSVVRERKALNAVRDMPVYWGDVVQTARGGRVRLQLQDGSILNVGSQSALLITQHNPTTQQTDLQIVYGRVRADVVRIVTPGGHFEMRTSSAVAGVIGTNEYVEATDIYTTVIALGGGKVTVRSTDPRFPTPIILSPGEATTVVLAHPPSPKRLATGQELQKAFAETEVSPLALASPGVVGVGQTAQVLLTGKGLAGTTGVTSTNAGIQVRISGPVTATQIPITVTVADNVAQGTYLLTVKHPGGSATALLIVTQASNLSVVSGGGGGGDLVPPTSQSFSVVQGTKFSLDASSAKTPTGTTVTAYQWQITGTGIAPTTAGLSSNQSTFLVDTSLLPPGNFTVQLVVVNDRGQTATQQFPLTVSAGAQPADVIAQLATAYESLQPSQFLSNFDPQNFANYAGFAQSVQDSFLNKLQSARVFQRPVNCTTIQQQDQAICQANFTVQFTLKNQPSQFLDANGNVVPAGTPGAVLGKPVQNGTELPTIRFSRSNAGWKVIGYNAQVTCPGGGTTNGVNVGSCLLAIGSPSSPSFQIGNLQLPTTDLFLGSTLSGSFTVTPQGSFNGSISYSAQGQVGNQTVSVTFSPNPSGPSGNVNFTITAPTVVPTGFNGSQTFTLVITGKDSAGQLTSSISTQLNLKGDFQLQLSPATSAGSPAPIAQGGTQPFAVFLIPGAGFTAGVAIDFPNLPTGFSVTPASLTITAELSGEFRLMAGGNASLGPQQITVRGTFGTGLVRTATLFVNVVAPFSLNVTPATSAGSPISLAVAGPSASLQVRVTAIAGFTGNVTMSILNLPTGLTALFESNIVPAGGTGLFALQAGPTTQPGPAQITLQGTSASGAAVTVPIFINVISPFTISVTPATTSGSPATVIPGGTLPLTVNVAAVPGSGFSGSVTLDLANPPSGFTATPVVVAAPGSTTLTVAIAGTAPLGAAQIVVRGTFSANSVVTSTVFLNVLFPFSLSLTPATTSASPAQVAQNSSFNLSVQVVAVAGFSGAGTISFASLPTGIAVSPTTANVNAGASGSFTVSAASNAATGPAQFTVVGSFNGNQTTATVFLNVTAPLGFALQVAPATSASTPVEVIPTGTLNLTVRVAPSSGFTGTVTISLQANSFFSATPIQVAAGSTGTLSVQVAAFGSLGPQQFVIQGTSGSLTQTSTVFANVLFPFTLNPTPATTQSSPVNVAQGGTFTATVQVAPVLGFSGSAVITLSSPFQVTPAGSVTVPAGGSANFQVLVPSNAAVTLTTIQVTGRISGSDTASSFLTFIYVNVTAPALFQIQQSSSNTAPLVLASSSSAVLPMTVVAADPSFASAVTLSFGVLPVGVTVSPTTATLLPGGTQNFTFSFTAQTNPISNFGIAHVTVTGTSGSTGSVTTHVVLNLVASSTAPFNLFAVPNSDSSAVILSLPGLTSAPFHIAATPATFNQPITITFGQLPNGVTVNPTALTFMPSTTGGTSGALQLMADPNVAVAGTYQIPVNGVSGGVSATTTLNLEIRGSFAISVSPSNTSPTSPLLLTPGSPTPTTVTVTVASVNGFSGTATVNVTIPFTATQVVTQPVRNLPNGISFTVTVPAGGQVAAPPIMLSAQTAIPATPPAAITITGFSNSGQALNPVTGPYLAIGPANFTVTLSPNTLTLEAGRGRDTIVTALVKPLAGFSGPVNLTVNASTLPSGLEIQPMQETIQPGGQGQFFVNAHGSAIPGNFPRVEIDATPVGTTTSQPSFLNVTIQGRINLNVTDAVITNGPPGTQTNPIPIAPATSHSFNVVVSGSNNFSGPVNLAAPTNDTNLTATFNPATVNIPVGGGAVTVALTLSVNASGLSFNFEQITVQALSPMGLSSTSPSQTIFITGTVTGFILGCDRGDHAVIDCAHPSLPPLILNINQAGSTATLQLRADSIGNLKDPVKVVASGLPPGVTMTPSSLIITPQNALAGTDTPVTFTAQGPSAVSGSFNFTLTGTDTVNTAVSPSSTMVHLTLNGSIQLATVPTTSPTNPLMIIASGTPQPFDVNVTSNGFTGTVTLSATSNAPFPVTITPPPTGSITVTAGGSTRATFNVTIPPGTPASAPFAITFDASATPNTYMVTGQTSVPLYLAVGPATFTMQILGAGGTLGQPIPVPVGSSFGGGIQVLISPIGTFSNTVTLDVLGLPAGVTASFGTPLVLQPTTKIGGTLSRGAAYAPPGSPFVATITFAAASNAPAGVIQATLSATSGSISQTMPLVLFVVPQVTLAVNPPSTGAAPLLVAPGGSGTVQVSLTATPSFTGAVDLTFRTSSPQLTVSPSSLHLNVGGFATLTLSVDPAALAGTDLFATVIGSINRIPVLTATNTVGPNTIHVTVGSGSFQLALNPPSAASFSTPVVVQPGGAAQTIGVTVTALGNFTGTVVVTAVFDRSVLSVLNPTQTVPAGQPANFQVSAPAGAAGGLTPMFFTSNRAGGAVTAFVSVGSGSFSLIPLTTLVAGVNAGGNFTDAFGIGVNREAGFSGPVTLAVSGLPAGVVISPNNVTVPPPTTASLFFGTPSSTQTFALKADPTVAAGDTPFTVTGTATGLTPVTTTLTLRVFGTYALNVSPGGSSTAPLVVAPGSSQPFTVSVASQSSFPAQSITITPDVSSLPAGVTITPASVMTNGTTPAAFRLNAATAAAATGELAVNIGAFSLFGATQPTATLFYTVGTAPTFNFSVAPQAGTVLGVLIGDTTGNSEFATLTPVGGFNSNVNGPVSITVNNLPAGVHASPAATIVSLAGTPVTVPINFKADSTVLPNFTQAVTITATAAAQPLVVPISLNLLGDYRLQGQATGTLRGGGNRPDDPLTIVSGTSPTSAVVNLRVNSFANFGNNTVNLTASGSLPAGVTASVTPTTTSVSPGTLTINVPANAPLSAVFPITVTATSPLAFTNPQTVTAFFQIVPSGTFQLTMTPPSSPVPVVIGSNQFVNFSLVLNGVGALATPTNLTIQPVAATVPPGVTITPSIGQATIQNNIGGVTLTLQVKADPPATAGMTSFQLQGTLATTPPVVATATVQLDLQGSYSLILAPSNSQSQPAVVSPGRSVTLTVNVVPQNGFTGTVTLTAACPPTCGGSVLGAPGVTVPNTLTASPSTPGQIVISASANAAPTAALQVPFTSSAPATSSSPTLPLFLAVGPPGISINGSFTSPSNPAAVMINGAPSVVLVQVVSLGGFSGNAIITVGAVPAGLSVSPQSASGTVTPQQGANQQGIPFTFQASQQAAQGLVSVPITVTSGSTTTTGFVYLYVSSNLALVQSPATSPQAPFNLTPPQVAAGIQIILQSQGGANTGQIPLTISGVPSGITVTPSSPLISPGMSGSVTLSILASAQATAGLHSFFVQTSFAGVTTQTTVWVFVGAGDFGITLTPSSSLTSPLVVNPGPTGTPVALTVTPINGFTGSVTVAVGTLPNGVSVIPASAVIQAGQTALFTVQATTALGTSPVQLVFTGNGVHTATVFALVNPPSFTLSKTAAPTIRLEQGNLQPFPFTVFVTGQGGFTGAVTISFADVPQGVNIIPPTATVQASASGTAVTFNLSADRTAVLGSSGAVSVMGTSGSQTVTFIQGIGVVASTSGIFVTTDPPTSATAPLLLQPDASLLTFLNINVFAKGGFTGTVSFQATQVPPGVTATLVPATADLTVSSMQVLQLQLRTTTGLAPFGPTQMNVASAMPGIIGGTGVFVALQGISAIAKLHPGGSLTAPQILNVQPDSGVAGTYTTVTIRGQSLSKINGVLADSSQISGKLEPGATGQQLQVTVFAAPRARPGRHSVLLIGPDGSVPIAFTVTAGEREAAEIDCNALRMRGVRLTVGACRPRPQNDTDGQVPVTVSTAVAVSGVVPAQLQPGATMDGRLVGSNLSGVTSVRVSGLGIRAQVLQATDSAVRVQFTVDPTALPGSHVVTVEAAGQTATAVVDVAAAAPASFSRRLTPAKTAENPAEPDQLVRMPERPSAVILRLADLGMSPARPKQGDTITFQMRVSNQGSSRAANVPVTFSIAGTRIQANQQVTLDPGQSQTFTFQWQALRSGRFEPQMVIDPDNRVAGLDRTETTATFPSFELSDAFPLSARASQLPAMRERAQLSVTLGGCSGLRLDSDNETPCGAADLELHLASSGGVLRFNAENVRNLGMVPLDRLNAAPAGALGHSEMVVPGSTYLVVSRNKAFVVLVLQVRGLESARNAPPPALRGPRLGGFGGPPRVRFDMGPGDVTLSLEWKQVPTQR